jgi:hypothetical protein
MSTTDLPEHHLTVRSTLIAVGDLDRAVSLIGSSVRSVKSLAMKGCPCLVGCGPRRWL